jgi:hypothetical protein
VDLRIETWERGTPPGTLTDFEILVTTKAMQGSILLIPAKI